MQPDIQARAASGLKRFIKQYRKRAANTARARGDFSLGPEVGQDTVRARLGVNAWFARKVREWEDAGRLTPDGRLRVADGMPPPWTLERIRAAAPEANEWDHLAALIFLDGVVQEGYMDAMQNIKQVVEGIAEERVKRALLDPENDGPIRGLIQDELAKTFGAILAGMKRGAPQEPQALIRTQRTCKKCGVKGHTTRTCIATESAAEDKWACIRCSNAQGRSLQTDPVMHPTPPAEFHKNDVENAD